MPKWLALLCLAPTFCQALEEKPWFGNLCEFDFKVHYDYNFFNRVDNAAPKLHSPYNTHLLALDLEVTVPPTWNWEVELEVADTSDVSWGYRSFAVQLRKLWLDDVCGDPFSLVTGVSYRNVPERMLKALSTPYHALSNFEFNAALGKEWSCGPCWFFRTYAVGAVGQGTSGSPWLRGDLYFWWNIQDCHQFRLYGQSYFGLGSKETVFLSFFKGWGSLHHQSIDLGVQYRYLFSIWASLSFDYLYRVYAHSYPEGVNTFLFSLDIPFSVF